MSSPNPNPNLINPNLEEAPEGAEDAEPSLGKKQRCVKPRAQEVFIDWEEDFQWQDTMDMQAKVLVGRVKGRNYIVARLKQWVVEIWGHHLANLPIV